MQFEQRWFSILNQLSDGRPQSVKSLAERIGISHASVSEARKSLEAAGYIEATPVPGDARQKHLTLTENGRSFVQKLLPVWQAMQVVSEVLNLEAGDVVASLDRLSSALEQRSLYERIMDELDP